MTRAWIAGHSHKSIVNIYVGNLGMETSGDDLRETFDAFGQVIDVTLMNNAYIGSHQQRAYAYIEMPRSEGEAAIAELDGTVIGNRIVNVVEALPLSPSRGTHCPRHKFRER